MKIWYLGVPFVVFPMIGNNIVRATGDTFMPGMLMLNSAIINVILDPLLIFGYGFFPGWASVEPPWPRSLPGV